MSADSRSQRAQHAEAALAGALDERQSLILRAVVTAYIGSAAPVGSSTISHLLPVRLSSASIRNTMAELARLGLIEKAHASSGRIPTAAGLRVFVDHLLGPSELGAYERRDLSQSFESAEHEGVGVVRVASQLLSDRTRQLGFVTTPRVDRMLLRHVSLVRLSSEKLLVVLVSESGETHRRVVDAVDVGDQARLDRIAASLSERSWGETLTSLRTKLLRESLEIASRADHVLEQALAIGLRVLSVDAVVDPIDLVIASRLALLEQPEFSDAGRLRDLFAALEDNAELVGLLDQMIDAEGVRVSLGEELEATELRGCALVAAPYRLGASGAPVGVLGVIGPSRMDYNRIIPLVGYCSQLVTEKF